MSALISKDIKSMAMKYSKVPGTKKIRVEWLSINGKRYEPKGTFNKISEALYATYLLTKKHEASIT